MGISKGQVRGIDHKHQYQCQYQQLGTERGQIMFTHLGGPEDNCSETRTNDRTSRWTFDERYFEGLSAGEKRVVLLKVAANEG